MKFIATLTVLASASVAMCATITGFAGADCTGSQVFQNGNVGSQVCLTFGGASVKSIRYSGVPSKIEFFISGGSHDICTNVFLTRGAGSGCVTAPAEVNWESVVVF